jgi:transposase
VSIEDKDARLAEFEVELASKAVALAERDAKIAERDAKIAELEVQLRRLNEKLNQNSSNSHLPPSSDGPGASKKNQRKPKAKNKRKQGAQKGHRGNHRQLLPPERVHEFVDVFPAACLGCATSLPSKSDSDPRRHQLLELEHNAAHVTEVRRHEVLCSKCGQRTRPSLEDAEIPTSPFGPRLVATVAMLTGVYHLSRRKTQCLLSELLGVDISLGTISAMEARASLALEPANAEAQREVEHAAVKHTDATGWVRAGVTMSLWTIASTMATVFHILDDGRRETIEPMYGSKQGILVSDRASVFGFWSMEERQICWAHLLRKFVSFSERDDASAAKYGHELLDYTALMFEYWHAYRDGELSHDQLEVWLRPVQQHFEATLERAVEAKIDGLSGSCANILAHAPALWTFVTHDGVEPTNNHAERELRTFVQWRKCCFGSQSERGERFAERVMTVAHTARKLGRSVLDFIAHSVAACVRGTSPPPLLPSLT